MAILMVICAHGFHYTTPHLRYAGWPRLAHSLLGAGHLGVQVFFVLSGFLISQPFFAAKLKARNTGYIKGYASRRLLKIIPPYYLMILFLMIFYFWRDQDWARAKLGIPWLVGLPDFVEIPGGFGFNGVFWSLWVEVGFYVLLPLIFISFKKQNCDFIGVFLTLILLIIPILSRGLSSSFDPTNLYHLARFPNGLTNFAWGVFFAYLYSKAQHDGKSLQKYAFLGYIGLILLFVAMFIDASYTSNRHTVSFEVPLHLSGFAAFLTLFFVLDPKNLGARFFSIPALSYCGIISYEWFLTHLVFLENFRSWMGIAYSTSSLSRYFFVNTPPIIASLILSAIIYHYFSSPIIKWGRKKWGKPRSDAKTDQTACNIIGR